MVVTACKLGGYDSELCGGSKCPLNKGECALNDLVSLRLISDHARAECVKTRGSYNIGGQLISGYYCVATARIKMCGQRVL